MEVAVLSCELAELWNIAIGTHPAIEGLGAARGLADPWQRRVISNTRGPRGDRCRGSATGRVGEADGGGIAKQGCAKPCHISGTAASTRERNGVDRGATVMRMWGQFSARVCACAWAWAWAWAWTWA